MTTGVTPELMTAEALFELGSQPGRCELIRGGLRNMTPAGHVHGKITARLTIKLGAFVENKNLGAVYAAETGFLIEQNPDTVRAPDVAFVKAHRLQHPMKATGFFPGPPDLAVEVLSPSDSYSDVQEKMLAWLQAGAEAVLLVDPMRKTAALHRSHAASIYWTEKDMATIPDLLPGWSLSLSELFV